MAVLGWKLGCLLAGVDLTVHTCIFLSVGAPPAITETLERREAPARSVTAARVAPCTGTVTAGPGSVSADPAPRGSDARNANRGTFYWKAIVFVGILLLSVFKEFSLSPWCSCRGTSGIHLVCLQTV